MMYTTFTEGLEEGLQVNDVYFMKEELFLTPSFSAIIWGLSGIPWLFKPLAAFFSDCVPICGYRRKSYLILAAAIHTLSLLGTQL